MRYTFGSVQSFFYEGTIVPTDELEKTQTKIAAVIKQWMFQKESLNGVVICHLVVLNHFVKYPIDFSSYKLTQNRNKRAFVGATLQTITFLLLDYNSQTYIDSSSFCYLFSWK